MNFLGNVRSFVQVEFELVWIFHLLLMGISIEFDLLNRVKP